MGTTNDPDNSSTAMYQGLWTLCCSLPLLLFFSYLFSVAALVTGISLTSMSLEIFLLATALTGVVLHKTIEMRSFPISIVMGLLAAISILVVTTIIHSNVLDSSFDGQAYHQEATLQLLAGWNPYLESSPQERFLGLEPWIQMTLIRYPKALTILSVLAVELTDSFEAGKALNHIFALTTLLTVFLSCLYHFRTSLISALAFSVAVTLNPIAVSQWFYHYNDGIVYYILTSAFFLGFFPP